MDATLLVFKVTGPISLSGPRDRLPLLPAPGAIPRGEPLLPRLETLIYALGHIALVDSPPPDTCEDVLHRILLWLADGHGEARVAGPFLRIETTTDVKIYMSVATHLLDLKALNEYISVADLLYQALRTPNPSKRHEALEEAKLRLARLEDENMLIPWEAVAQRRQRHALNSHQKSVLHGHLFSETRVDYRPLTTITGEKLVSHPEIILVAWAPKIRDLNTNIPLTPLKTPTFLSTREAPIHIPMPSRHYKLLATTPTPVDEYSDCRPIHPMQPHPSITILASTCRTRREHFTKTRPKLAYHPGTLLRKECDKCEPIGPIHHALDPETLSTIRDVLTCSYSETQT